MEATPTTSEHEAVLEEWKQAFIAKRKDDKCPHEEEHETWFELKDLKYDGFGSFTYHVDACCEGFRILILQRATSERMYNPPKFKSTVPDAPVQRSETPAAFERKVLKDKGHTDGHAVVQAAPQDHVTEMTRSSVERWYQEVWNEHEAVKIHEWVAEDCRVHALDGALSKGAAPFEKLYLELHWNTPGLHLEAIYHVVQHDKSASVIRVTGSERETQKRIEFIGMTFLRWKDGKIIEAWNLDDLDPAQRLR